MNSSIVKIIYNDGTVETMEREAAKNFFIDGARYCDGSEALSYMNMYDQLCSGCDIIRED